jgi:hypothetical protein
VSTAERSTPCSTVPNRGRRRDLVAAGRDLLRQLLELSPDDLDCALGTLAELHDLTAIALITSLTEQAERFFPQLVHDARANGHTWLEIAHALGTSPDTAQLRFDPESPIADSRWPHQP